MSKLSTGIVSGNQKKLNNYAPKYKASYSDSNVFTLCNLHRILEMVVDKAKENNEHDSVTGHSAPSNADKMNPFCANNARSKDLQTTIDKHKSKEEQ